MTKFVQQKYITSIGLSSLSTRGDKYNFRCPFCGDSKKNQRKKRGWLLWNEPFDTYIFSRHNCGINTNFDKMLEENFIDEYNLYRSETRATRLEKYKGEYKPQVLVIKSKKKVEEKNPLKNPHNLKLFDKPSIFEPIEQHKAGMEYLDGRLLSGLYKDYMVYYGVGKMKHKGVELDFTDMIIVPFVLGDKWYGFQARSIKEKKFLVILPEENQGFKVWNFFNVDLTKPVYVFESIYDAYSSGKENVIAQAGATLSDSVLKLIKPIFCLDNQFQDDTANKESMKYIDKGFNVFVWDNRIKEKDFNSLLVKVGLNNKNKISKLIDNRVYKGLRGTVSLRLPS